MVLGCWTVISPLQHLVTLDGRTVHDVASVRDIHFLLLDIARVQIWIINYDFRPGCIITLLTDVAGIDSWVDYLDLGGVGIAIVLGVAGLNNGSVHDLDSCIGVNVASVLSVASVHKRILHDFNSCIGVNIASFLYIGSLLNSMIHQTQLLCNNLHSLILNQRFP